MRNDACQRCEQRNGRRTRCKWCRRLLCMFCLGNADAPCPDCGRQFGERQWRAWLGAGRLNERFHDCLAFVAGVLVPCRVFHRPGRQPDTWCHAVHRAGVDADYVDSQYHGGNAE